MLDFSVVHQYVAPVVTGTFLLLIGMMIRGVRNLDTSVKTQNAAQAVVNEKVVGALNVITERLNGHEVLDDRRVGEHDRRISRLEQVAFEPPPAYRGRHRG